MPSPKRCAFCLASGSCSRTTTGVQVHGDTPAIWHLEELHVVWVVQQLVEVALVVVTAAARQQQ
jgi:hypothetical protein